SSAADYCSARFPQPDCWLHRRCEIGILLRACAVAGECQSAFLCGCKSADVDYSDSFRDETFASALFEHACVSPARAPGTVTNTVRILVAVVVRTHSIH